MPILDLEDSQAKRPASKKPLKLVLGMGVLVGTLALGSTFASNISLNSGANSEFGQGIATTAACDSNIEITPITEFKNSEIPSESRYPMQSMNLQGIDLTPEGWDLTLEPAGFDPSFNPSLDPEERSWDSGFENRAGTYKNESGEIVNTCEGKVLLLRAYTNNADYSGYTVDGDINSPLWLNRAAAGGGGRFPMAPAPINNVNAGVGVRLYYVPTSLSLIQDPLWVADAFTNNGSLTSRFSFNPIDFDGNWGDVNPDWSQSSISIYLNVAEPTLLAVDSRVVDKITIESNAIKPSAWEPSYDWFGQLS